MDTMAELTRVRGWPKKPHWWWCSNTWYISVPFTWQLPALRQDLLNGDLFGFEVRVGGPAVKLMPDYLGDIAGVTVGGEYRGALQVVNPRATRTTLGCPRACGFCGVPRFEGEFRELEEWPDLPVICDSNLLASSLRHFERVVDRLKRHKQVDFNQGLDARLMTPHHAYELSKVEGLFRLSWDGVGQESAVLRSIQMLTGEGIPRARIRCYVLVGWRDAPEEVAYRMERLKAVGVLPNPQRYVPLDSLTGKFVGDGWTERELRRFCRYWSRRRLYNTIRYEDFDETR